MKVIGLTGGIGSGKTTVAGVLEKHFSMKVLYTDEITREQMLKGGLSYQAVVDAFGKEILKEDGEIDREKLSDMIYEDEEKQKKLNALTHPNTEAYLLSMIKELKEMELFKAVFIETALFIEAGYKRFCDEVWYVYAPEEERRERLLKCRNLSADKLDLIFSKQCSDEEYRKCADKVLDNRDAVTVNSLFEQILSFIE